MIRFSFLQVNLMICLLFGNAAAHAENTSVKPPDNFIAWRAGLSSAAQPSSKYLEQAGQMKYQLVINLAPPESWGSIENEGALIGKQGLAYVNIPVSFEEPRAEDFELFSGMLQAAAGKNVLVHCQANFRGSSFVFLYRVIVEKIPVQEAAAKLTAVWVPDAAWKKFIQETLASHGYKEDFL
ncbi:protein tyrosine phosphatase family protein [Undibacterium sp. TJN25]|uniref:protein tyrosine phosphatase family protein n=1 Tax=Undibacterium sp. TJN25 TaxID=3413056 RepID=UPI003BF20F0C